MNGKTGKKKTCKYNCLNSFSDWNVQETKPKCPLLALARRMGLGGGGGERRGGRKRREVILSNSKRKLCQ